MSAILQCYPFDILKNVIRETPKPFKMIDTTKSDHYKHLYNLIKSTITELDTIKYLTTIDRNIRVKHIKEGVVNNLKKSTWFNEDRLTYNNKFLKQFDDAVNLLIERETVISEQVVYIKEAKDWFAEWVSVHKEMIGFTYVYHHTILPILENPDSFDTDEKIEIFINSFNEIAYRVIKEIEMIEIYKNQRSFDIENKEAKLIALQGLIKDTGIWQ